MLDTKYEMPWRPNFEARAAAGWVFAAAGIFGVHAWFDLPVAPCYAFSALSGSVFIVRGAQGWRHHVKRARLCGKEITFITHAELEKRFKGGRFDRLRGRKDLQNNLYLGEGFEWTQRECQLLADILSRDPAQIGLPSDAETMGARWIHGLGTYEREILIKLGFFDKHLGVFGTTGSGKTRFYDMIVTQAIRRNECVILIDPKGDKELRDNMFRACVLAGKGDKFIEFHPAHPKTSCRINPLKNYSRPTELASRIAALIPSETGADPFKAFCQNALNNIIQGMILVGQIPLLTGIKSLIDGGVDDLCIKAIETYFEKFAPNWRNYHSKVEQQLASNKNPRITALDKKRMAMTITYWEYVKEIRADSDLEGLINMAEHDRDHLSRMIASLTPILGMLTSGEMGRLLSPDDNDESDLRRNLDLTRVMDNQMVLYVGLDSLSDSMVGSAIGSMLLSDITAIAGARYNYSTPDELQVINILVDEAAEVINDPFIQALNKGRGAKFRLVVATQTLSDFITRCGSDDKAYQVLGNINNWVSFRVIDVKTQTYLSDYMPKTKIKYLMHTQGQSTDDGIKFKGNGGERLMSEEAPLFPPAMLGRLPDLEYIVNFGGGQVWKGRLPILTAKKPPSRMGKAIARLRRLSERGAPIIGEPDPEWSLPPNVGLPPRVEPVAPEMH